MNQRFEQTAFYPADILLPQTAEMKKWPVVACDQFTSQPDYWQAAEAAVGEAPSALRLVLPGDLSERPRMWTSELRPSTLLWTATWRMAVPDTLGQPDLSGAHAV